MASMGLPPINLPEYAPDVAADEAYDREIAARLNHDNICTRFCELLETTLMDDAPSALSNMRTLLSDVPLRDDYDLSAWAQVGQPSDASLAHLVRKLYGMPNLAEVERVKGQLGDVAF
jgi:hypothetical protein